MTITGMPRPRFGLPEAGKDKIPRPPGGSRVQLINWRQNQVRLIKCWGAKIKRRRYMLPKLAILSAGAKF
jgi:hypothetical protein